MKNIYHFTLRIKRIAIVLLFTFLACYSEQSFAQAGTVNISVNIIPPYSPYYADYSGPNASKVLLIVTNTTATPRTLKLTGQLEGDNGIKISTKSTYVPLQPIVLGPNETKQLNGLALKDIFDLNSLNVYGVDKSRLIYTSRLPEGNYTFCIQAVEINTNQVLSSTAPLGCTTITIAYPEAPVLVNPLTGSNEKALAPQATTFNWINPGNTPGMVQYILQVAEMPNAINNPTQVLNATSFPYINKTLTNATSYTLSANDPPLQIGKTYAWRVKATDPSGKILFKNDGVSGANVFTYGDVQQIADALIKDIPILLPDPKNFGKEVLVNNKNPLYIRWKLINIDENNLPSNIDYGAIQNINPQNENALKYQITISDKSNGKVVDIREGFDVPFYQEDYDSQKFIDGHTYTFVVKAFKASGIAASVNKLGSGQLQQPSKSLSQGYNTLTAKSIDGSFIFKRKANEIDQLPAIVLNGKVQYQFENEPDYYPITGSMRLTKYFKQVDASGNTTKDNISVASVNGAEPTSYIVNLNSLGVFSAKVEQTPKLLTGSLVPYFVIDFPNNNYYSKPDKLVTINGEGTTFNVGEFTSMVSSYDLNLHISKGYVTKAYTQKAGTPPDVLRVTQALSGLKVSIYRNPKTSDVPQMEAGRKSTKTFLYKFTGVANAKAGKFVDVVVSDTTRVTAGALEATVSFSKLICALGNNDLYWINVLDPKTGELVIDQPFNFRGTLNVVQSQSADKYYTSYKKKSDYTYEVEKNLNWTTEKAPAATVKGKIMYQYKDGIGGAMPLANADIKLVPFVVFSEKAAGGRTYVFPASMMNQSGNIGSGIKINPSNPDGTLRKADEKDNKFIAYTEGVVQNSGTKTLSDGSFEFKDIPLWDSVTVAKGLFSFAIVAPPIPTPPQTTPAKESLANIWQSMQMGNDVSQQQQAFQNMVMNDAKNPLLDPNSSSSVKQTLSEIGQATQGANIGGAAKLGSNITSGNVAGSYSAAKNVGANLGAAAIIQHFVDGPSAQQEEIDLSNPLYAETGIKSNGGCEVKMVYRVVIQEKGLYCSPDNDITVNPLQVFDAGLMYSVVRSAKVNVRLYKKDTYNEKAGTNNLQIYNIPIELTRVGHSGLPGEGKPYNNVLLNDKASTNVNLVDVGSSQDAGRTFNHVLQTRNYQLYPVIKDESNTLTSYKPAAQKFYLSDVNPDPLLYLGKDFLFGSEFTEPVLQESIVLEPDDPIIAGRLVNSITQNGIANVSTVTLSGGLSTSLKTDAYGYFSIKSSAIVGKSLTLRAYADGYVLNDSSAVNNGKNLSQYTIAVNNLQKGGKTFNTLYFMPSSTLSGYVINSKGEHLPALYKIDNTDFIQETSSECTPVKVQVGNGNNGSSFGGFSVNTTFLSLSTSDCKQNFKAYTESGKPARLIIIPNDIKYFNDTLDVASVKKGDTQLGARTLVTREHRINFRIKGPGGEPIFGALVQILDKAYLTDKYGVLRYSFMNISEKNFWVKITPPPGSDYIPMETSFTNTESKTYVDQVFTMNKGLAFTGTVKLEGVPLANATVYINNGEGAIANKTTTDQKGFYTLHGVLKAGPHYDVVVSASGPKSDLGTIVGQKVVTKDVQANFDLTLLKGVNASKILGYEVSLESASPSSNGNLLINGTVNLASTGGDFKMFDPDTRISFSNLVINPHKKVDNGEIAEPLTDITLNLSQFKTRYKEAYNVDMLPTGAKIVIKKLSPATGALQVKAKIADNSFNFPSSYFKFAGTNFYFAKKIDNAFSNVLYLFATAPILSVSNYNFTDQNGGAIAFKLMDFAAVTPADQTYFSEGKIRMQPTITATKVNTLGKNISITLPEFKISQNGVDDINSSTPIELKLEQWTLKIPKWKMSTEEGGIVSTSVSNTIQTGVLDIPFGKFRLRNDILLVADANVKKINLAGLVNVNLNANAIPTFGLDQKIGNDLQPHYILRMLGKDGGSAGYLDPLDGLPQGLDIYAATLVSSGEQYIDFSPNSKVIKAFDLIDFKPSAIESSNGTFSILGDVNLGIPRLQNFFGGFRYKKEGNVVKGRPDFRNIKFDIGKGYVVFNSPTDPDNKPGSTENYPGKKTVSKGKIELVGYVYEPVQLPEDRVTAILTRDVNKTDIQIYGTPTIPFGDENMKMYVSSGGTTVVNKDWDYLTFTGTVRKGNNQQPEGFDDANPLTFKVFGEIAYDSGKIKVKQMKTPLGDLNMVFDFPNKKIMGSLKMKNLEMGGVKLTGVAEINIDKNGFYTFVAADAAFNVPILSPLKAGFLAGYYTDLQPDVIARTMQFNYNKEKICEPMKLLGFVMCGRKDLFKDVKFHLDLPPLIPIVSVGLVAECGVDASLTMNFAPPAPEMALSVGAFGKVNVSLSSITGTSAQGNVEVDLTGKVKYVLGGSFDAEFCSSAILTYHVHQSLLVTSVDAKGTMTLSARGGIKSGDTYFELANQACNDDKGKCQTFPKETK